MESENILSSGRMPAAGSSRSVLSFMLEAALRFTLVSLAGFSVWACAGRWFYRNVGEAGLYAVTTLVFLGSAVVMLYPLVTGPRRMWRWAMAFVPAFVAYAVAWCVFWFAMGSGLGEWLGSLLGSFVFVAVMQRGLGEKVGRGWLVCGLVVFVLHSAGYFAGGWLTGWIVDSSRSGLLAAWPEGTVGYVAKLAWGLAYGVGFGAGIGFTLYRGRE